MSRKDALAAHHLNVGIRGRAQRSSTHLPLKKTECEKRRVSFVHVINVDAVAQGVGHARATHAKHNFLLESQLGTATV